MKKLVTLCISLSWLSANAAIDGEQPQGRLIELHSCEVYAGACMVSSQSELGGRNTLQVWDISGGNWQGVRLAGLRVAVLESSSENLAVPEARADQAIVYLPESANAEQRGALLAWVKSRDSQLSMAKIQTRVALQNQKTFKGRLRGLQGGSILLETPKGDLMEIPLDVVHEARLEFDWAEEKARARRE